MAGPKTRKKLKKKDINISERVGKGSIEGIDESVQQMISGLGSTAPFIADKEKEIWVIEDNEEPFYVTPESEDFKRMKKEPKDIGAFAGGGRVIKYFNRGGGVYGYNQGGGVNKHQGQYDIQVKKIKGKGKVL